MTHPCFAQKFCRSRISDWKLKTSPRQALGSPRPRAIGSVAAGRRGGNISAANPTGREIFGVERRTRRRRAAPRQLARRPVQPTVADPHRGNDQNEHDQLRKCKHNRVYRQLGRRFEKRQPSPASAMLGTLSRAAGEGEPSLKGLVGEGDHSPNLAHRRRVSIQSASSAISETGSRPDERQAAQERQASPLGRNGTQPDLVAVSGAHDGAQLADAVDQARDPSPCARSERRR